MPAVHAFPQSEATDPDNVADALDAGLLHWAKGETAQALSSLRQAIELSYEAGQEQRSLALTHTAADLAGKSSPSTTPLPPQNDGHSPDPRRARLPDPPAPTKRFGMTADATPAPTAPTNGSPSSAVSDPAAVAPHSIATVSEHPLATRSASGSAAASSVRPIPPSARPSATNSPVPQSGTIGARSIASDRVIEPSPAPGTPQVTAGTELPSPAPTKSEPTKSYLESTSAVPAKKHGSLSDSRSFSPEPRAASGSVVPNNARGDARPSQRAASIDHRLASLRVRIDRVESDGTIRVKLLDLAATASGEDNALLIVPQLLWQELKHGG